ncbi:hypothetical protein FGO68_gene13839 [Halteria grandinella]|uniref:J domain-containing protein n=1 Tax=Halteria grandinella TaxID=5974 RepID=A0A8J8NXA3_HALGN|nr:hypothetical protein FGO68_gene13839 [Halteria grandinella]
MNKLNAFPLLWKVSSPNALLYRNQYLITIHVRKITTLEARRIMQIPDGSTQAYNDDFLKKQYIKLAKVYHPDAQGTAEKFQQLQEAYGRLKAESKGYTLTEDDLFKMYQKHQEKDSERQEDEQNKHRDMYQDDEDARESFEKWKKQQFSAYDQQVHDEFLKNRYQRTFYKYTSAQSNMNQRRTNDSDEQQFKSSFSSQTHFNESKSDYRNEPPHVNPNGKHYSMKHNSKLLAFFTNGRERNRIIDLYHDEILFAIILCGIAFNVMLYYYLQMRKKLKRQDELQKIMDQNAAIQMSKRNFIMQQAAGEQKIPEITSAINRQTMKIYVDNKMVMENQISMDDLIRMSDQTNKFQLSNYLIRKVRREKVKRGLVEYDEDDD